MEIVLLPRVESLLPWKVQLTSMEIGERLHGR